MQLCFWLHNCHNTITANKKKSIRKAPFWSPVSDIYYGALWYTFGLTDFAVNLLLGRKYQPYCFYFVEFKILFCFLYAYLPPFISAADKNCYLKLGECFLFFVFAITFSYRGIVLSLRPSTLPVLFEGITLLPSFISHHLPVGGQVPLSSTDKISSPVVVFSVCSRDIL